MKHIYNKIRTEAITDFLKDESETGKFKMKITNYTISAEVEEEKYFFSNEPMNKTAFIFYNMMKKDIGGEIRPEAKNINYFDFSGVNAGDKIEQCYCIDINSAYLSVLKNEKIISHQTFNKINDRTRKNDKTKMDRLKSVGMFASNPSIIDFENWEAANITNEKNPFSWVFYEACQKTNEIIKSCIDDNFLFYWVDGIFVTGNQQEIKRKIQKMGYACKIEKINNLEVFEKNIVYEKQGKEKILFLPIKEKKIKFNFQNAVEI
jgi:hypothetical protein